MYLLCCIPPCSPPPGGPTPHFGNHCGKSSCGVHTDWCCTKMQSNPEMLIKILPRLSEYTILHKHMANTKLLHIYSSAPNSASLGDERLLMPVSLIIHSPCGMVIIWRPSKYALYLVSCFSSL